MRVGAGPSMPVQHSHLDEPFLSLTQVPVSAVGHDQFIHLHSALHKQSLVEWLSQYTHSKTVDWLIEYKMWLYMYSGVVEVHVKLKVFVDWATIDTMFMTWHLNFLGSGPKLVTKLRHMAV